MIAVLDARESVTDQDAHLVGLAAERGRALAIAVNKWDGLDGHERRLIEREVERKLDFVPYASLHYVSALHGSGIAELVKAALVAYKNAGVELATPRLNRVLEDALQVNPPPLVRGRHVRLRYAHQGGRYPPVIVVHGTQAHAAARSLQALSRERVSRSAEAQGHAGARRAADGRESVRRPAQQAHAAAGEESPAHAAVQAQEMTGRRRPNHIARS